MARRRWPLDDEPVTVEEAYEDLTHHAFAVWIRLLAHPKKEIFNRKKISTMLDYSRQRCNEVLRELYHKSYIHIEPPTKPGQPSKITIVKRCKIVGPTQFLTLSNVLYCPISELSKSEKQTIAQELRFSDSVMDETSPFYELLNVLNADSLNEKEQRAPRFLADSKNDNNSEVSQVGGLAGARTTHGILGKTVPKKRKKMIFQAPIESLLDEESHSCETSASQREAGDHKSKDYLKSPKLNLGKYKNIRDKIKQERSERAKRAKKKNRRFAQNIDWTKLDQRGDPAISFSPSKKERIKLIEILDRPPRNPTKLAILKKMASEFGRIYSRYRRELQKEAGNKPSYLLPDEERKYAQRAAEWCIRKEVTPRQVLTYWHYHIANFAERTMRIPPLIFLSSPANIDTVACASLEDESAGWKAGKPKSAAPKTHGFSDETQLDPRLRKALEKAGYSTTAWPDRYLLTIQKTAEAIAKGARMFVGAEMKPMVDWAVENLYE